MKRIVPLLLLLAALGGGWWFYGNHVPRANYSGAIEAEDATLGSKVGGRVAEVLVQEGDTVQHGDVLVRLDREPLEARLREALADLERARQKLLELENGSRPQEIQRAQALLDEARHRWELLKNGPREEDIRAARANLQSARAELELATITEKRQCELYKKNNTSADALDRARKELSVAQGRERAAQAQLDLLLAGFREEEIQSARAQVEAASAALALVLEGPRVEQIEQARAEVKRAEASVERIQVDLSETVITAPSEGVIETCRLRPGDLLAPNQAALTMILYEPLWVRIFVPESRLGLVPLGRTLYLSTASFPGEFFKGTVVQVNRKAEFTPRNVQTPETRDYLVFGVKIEIQDPERRLRPGMVADVFLSDHPKAGGPEP
ncbi:MAG: HlyD family efflux transporter periplasmic adaptor subunit [Candidatus Omnitrophica bacterium]|nr:HlyD family efflux transporter periplasmic adaptor subunit [Candidatus Omnitrophota bacterium]